MASILLIIHLIITIALIAVILLQKNEGGALGIGGGGGGGGMGGIMTSRGSKNFLTRTTSILATCFIGLSLTLAILAKNNTQPRSIADEIIMEQQQQRLAPPVRLEESTMPPAELPNVPLSE